MRALIMGRFQPFHKGHLQLVRSISKECDELIISIASAQFNFMEKDPFTAGERILMIHEALKDAGIDLTRCYIVPLVNDENNARWIGHVSSFLPHFDVVYTGNPYVDMLMKNSNIKVKRIKFYEREKYKSSHVRELMTKGSDWESLVPNSVAKVIKTIEGVQRMKVIMRSDTRPQEW